MNRIEVPTVKPDHVCHVGYDFAVDSYFGHVARKLVTERGKIKGEHDGHTIIWIGTTDKEIKTVEELKWRLTRYARLSDETLEELRAMRERAQPPDVKTVEYKAS